VKIQVFLTFFLFSGQVLGYRDRYITDHSETGGSVGYFEGLLAIIGLVIVWKLFKCAVNLFSESWGWRKLVSPALIIGLFVVNDMSKQNETSSFLHICLLLVYLCASVYLGAKLSNWNKKNKQV